jgi:hypothetical protein
MSLSGLVHIAAACITGLLSIVALFRCTEDRDASWRRAASASAAVALILALSSQRSFEVHRLRAVYRYSRWAGEWLERHAHFGFAALVFALALGLAPSGASPRARRSLCAFVHAAAPHAALESAQNERDHTPMKSRCAKLRSSCALKIFCAADSMSYSTRLNSNTFAVVSYTT